MIMQTCYPRLMASEKFEAQFEQLRGQIKDLLHKLDVAAGREVEALRPKLKAAEEKLHKLKEHSGEAWGDLKPGLGKAWDELQKSLGQAATRFKNKPKE